MIARKVSAFSVHVLLVSILWLIQTENFTSTTEIECIPLKLCPLAMKLIQTKPYAQETITFLRFSHCGFDGQNPKIWCTLFAKCKTPDSRNGICKKINDCNSFMDYLENLDTYNPVVKKYLKEYKCSTDHDPELKICCPHEDKTALNDVHERFSNYLPDPDLGECGRQNSDNKIIGGTKTSLDEYPWMALLKYVKGKTIQYACGGSLINDRFVLTAAHCVDPKIIKEKNLGRLQNIILGEYDIKNKTDCIYQKYGTDCADPPQEFAINDYVMHPNYDSKFMINDIAIIRLDRKAILSDYVQPICLPGKDLELRGNETFTISGWGRTENEKRSSVKRKAIVNYANQDSCNQYNGRRKLSRGQICAGRGKGVDSCYGDSGGPLMLEIRTASGAVATFAIGMVSYGYGQFCGSFPGVYTYLPHYINWIDSEMR